jgi:Ca2+:H+ antiporter
MKPRHVPLLMLPVALAAPWLGLGPLATFAAAAIGLAGLAGLLGEAIEAWALHAGPRVGGMLGAGLGGLPHLLIAGFALHAGLLDLVKASITGALITNLVLVLGLSAFLGGLRYRTQYFHRERANIATTMLALSVIALGIPTFYGQLVPLRNAGPVESLSEAVAAVMLVVYLLSRYFHLVWSDEASSQDGTHPPTRWSRPVATAIMIGALVAITALAGLLIDATPAVMRRLGITELFIGIVIIPLVSNAATSYVAVRTAWRNRMDLSLVISADASIQAALFIAPLLVFISLLLSRPMDLVFSTIELAAMAAAAAIAALVASDGESNWLEGVMLIAVYLLLGLAFLWWPV